MNYPWRCRPDTGANIGSSEQVRRVLSIGAMSAFTHGNYDYIATVNDHIA
jgi:hypothetical protein